MLSLNDDCIEYLIRKVSVDGLTRLSMTSHDMQTLCLNASRQIIDDFKRASKTEDIELSLPLENPFHRMARLFGMRFCTTEFELACLDSIQGMGPWFADPKCEPAAIEKLWAVLGRFPMEQRGIVGVKRTRLQLPPELGEPIMRIACILVQFDSNGIDFTVKHRHIDDALEVIARSRPFAILCGEKSA